MTEAAMLIPRRECAPRGLTTRVATVEARTGNCISIETLTPALELPELGDGKMGAIPTNGEEQVPAFEST
ncbi:MAG: hypothetical protein QOH61_2518 [Chloroflexota bacterium]|nr:hypothetical protein [Chloroflexota bacterium]